MSKRITDAQIYGLLWMRSTTFGAISELHGPPQLIELPDRRTLMLYRTAFDRQGLLGLVRRGFAADRKSGLYEITDAGINELTRPAITRRVDDMVEQTTKYQTDLNNRVDD